MTSIPYVTTNTGKVTSMARALAPFDLVPEHVALELDEPQTPDIRIIATSKAKHAFNQLGRPCIVLDAGFEMDAWRGFPGAIAKLILPTLGLAGLLKLAEGTDRACAFTECLAFADGTRVHLFDGRLPGTVAESVRGDPLAEAWSELSRIFIPEGMTQTLAEMDEQERAAWRRERGNVAAVKFARWYVDAHKPKA